MRGSVRLLVDIESGCLKPSTPEFGTYEQIGSPRFRVTRPSDCAPDGRLAPASVCASLVEIVADGVGGRQPVGAPLGSELDEVVQPIRDSRRSRIGVGRLKPLGDLRDDFVRTSSTFGGR